MKKIIHVAGILTAGVASTASLCQAASYSAADGSRPWSISAAVKGFYDDNIYAATGKDKFAAIDPATGHLVSRKVESYGVDLSPSVRLNLPLDQTLITAGYQYGMRWYEARKSDDIDQYHLFNAGLSHQFDNRFKLDLRESLSVAQEPELASSATATRPSVAFRSQGDNIINNAGASISAELTRPLSLVVSYDNVLVDYDEGSVNALATSYAGALNRMEHAVNGSLRYQLRPTTVGLIGYEYGVADYDLRDTSDNTSHRIFAGVDHSFTSQLTGSLRAGVQITEFDKLLDAANNKYSESSTTPYVDASLSYNYTTSSYITVGVKHMRTATDVLTLGVNPITDADTTAGYVSVSHAITEKFRASVIGQYQNSAYQGADHEIKGFDENYFSAGVSLSYRLTRWMSAEANYYHDTRDTDIFDGAVSYNRNRVFLGLRFTY